MNILLDWCRQYNGQVDKVACDRIRWALYAIIQNNINISMKNASIKLSCFCAARTSRVTPGYLGGSP